jgi:hypothetical protein
LCFSGHGDVSRNITNADGYQYRDVPRYQHFKPPNSAQIYDWLMQRSQKNILHFQELARQTPKKTTKDS